ncbi:MAG: hypothetical protein ACI8W8_003363 [Rhodothermales bacterium]|jgi:hypothetical protein
MQLTEELEDYADLRALRDAKAAEQDAPTVSLSAVKEMVPTSISLMLALVLG